MRRKEAKPRRMSAYRARPAVEGLEGRQLLSAGASRGAADQAPASSGGVLSAKGQVFRYVTITGGIATIKIVGVGSLAGTSVDSSGNLDIVYGGTNAYSKIVGTVKGGGHAELGSILNAELIAAGTPDSLTGVGGTPLASVLMDRFNLVPGGTIILTPGVTGLVLNSIGPDTDVQLRTLPPAPSYRILPANAGNTAGGESGLYGQLVSSSSTTTTSSGLGTTSSSSSSSGTNSSSELQTNGVNGGVPATGLSPTETIVGTTIVPIVTGNSSLSNSGSVGASSTLEAQQSASITFNQGTTLSYLSDGGRDQVLSGVSGSFTAQSNLLEPLATGQALTEPPAPPGIILKARSIGGSTSAHVNPLTDSKIFGYDPTTGDVVRFNLNLQTNTGTVDSTFTPIPVPGAPATADIDIAHLGTTPVLLAASGTTVYAYNADTGAPIGSFSVSQPVSFLATAGNITVLGSTSINQMHMINLAESLQTGTVVGLDSTSPFVPASEVFLLGGVTGVAGSNDLYASIGAHFSSVQPDQYQFGVAAIGTTNVNSTAVGTTSSGSTAYQVSGVSNGFSSISRTGLVSNGNYVTVDVSPIPADQIGPALGAVDQNLALDTGVANGKNVLKLYSPSSLSSKGQITLNYGDQLTGLSESFRDDVTGVALISIQGNVQSIRGNTADGMFLNDTGNLATIKIQHINNSTIVGQPLSHVDTTSRSNTTILTSSREVGDRNGVTQVSNIQPIGPFGPSGGS